MRLLRGEGHEPIRRRGHPRRRLGATLQARPPRRARLVLSPRDLDAVVFDMDGVVTQTATVHAAAWKQLFDSYLETRARRLGETHRPFDARADYRRYVDGKNRYDGVRDFLESRGITLPHGSPDDPGDRETVCGLGNLKNDFFRRVVADTGVAPFETTVEFIHKLKRARIHVAIISASKNATAILTAAGVRDLFEAQVDGNVADELGLAGKPAPDVFLEAARRLGVPRERAAIVEDAIAGMEAGRRGDFELVLGIDREGDGEAMLAAGGDVVVSDLAEVDVET